MADTRTFPNVEFVNKTAEEIFAEEVQAWESAMGRSLAMADPYRLLIGWASAIDAQLYAAINESAKLNMPRYAFGDYLDSMAELFYMGLTRLPASAAKTTIRFTLSEPSESVTAVPVGTQCTKDGTAIFATTETAYIPAGDLSVDVPAECTAAGIAGNGYEAGTIDVCMDRDNVTNLESVSNITVSEGGADVEGDEEFYERMRESMGAYSTAGSEESYIYHARSANANVGGVRVRRPEPGCVDVFILKTDGSLPDAELIQSVEEHLSSDTVRPLTDYVTVKAPTPQEFTVNVTWYMERDSAVSYEQAESDIEAAIQEYLTWQTTEIGRDINPDVLTRNMMQTGIKRIEITEPHFTTVSDYAVAYCVGVPTVSFGGVEDA